MCHSYYKYEHNTNNDICVKEVNSSRLGLVGHWEPMPAKKRHLEQWFSFGRKGFIQVNTGSQTGETKKEVLTCEYRISKNQQTGCLNTKRVLLFLNIIIV